MCQTACPVLINTGDLVRRLRAERAGKVAAKGWGYRGRSTGRAPPGRRSGALTVGREAAAALVAGPNALGRTVIATDVLPLCSAELPARRAGAAGADSPNGPRPPTPVDRLLRACVGTMFGPGRRRPGRAASRSPALCERAGDLGHLPGGPAVAVLRHAVEVQGHEGRLRG